MCDYGCSSEHLGQGDIVELFDSLYEPNRGEVEILLLGSLGSILDEDEFSADLFEMVLECTRRSDARIVIFETAWGTVNSCKVGNITRALKGKEVYFECGLESSSEHVRQVCYGKQVRDEVVGAAIGAIHSAGAKVIANLMLGAPFMSDEERISDAYRSVMDSFCMGIDEVALFPLNVKPYTAVRRLYDSGQYEPPTCADLLALLAVLPSELLGEVSLSWWGNRNGGYSLPDVAPEPSASGVDLRDVFCSYMNERSAKGRRDIVEGALLLLPEALETNMEATIPGEGQLLERRAIAASVAERMPFGQHLAWVGPRESDIDSSGELFELSSTVFGSDARGNRSYCAKAGRRTNHDDVTQDQISAMANDQASMIQKNPGVRFVPYNPYYAFGGDRRVLEREVCLNEKGMLDMFCDKATFREFARNYAPTPESVLVDAFACEADLIREMRPQWESFVVQRGISSGGYETYLIEPNCDVPGRLRSLDEKLLVSEYVHPNVPVNVHFVVFDDCCLMLPASVQVIVAQDGKLVYGGCDYVCYRNLPGEARRVFERYARVLADAVRRSGYRGVLGFDAVIRGSEAFFLEMNARFQASTHALNRALRDAGLPSVHKLHLESFAHACPSVSLSCFDHVSVNYSSVAYHSSGTLEGDAMAEHIRERIPLCQGAELYEDGEPLQIREPGAYLFSAVYPGRISALNVPDGVTADQNVVPDIGCFFDSDSVDMRFMSLKIALINQGARLADSALDYAEERGGFRAGVNDSIDIVVSHHVVNVPVAKPYVELSPFELRAGEMGLALYYLQSFISDVEFYSRVGIELETTSSGARIGSICFLAADRIRIQHHDRCDFACVGRGCAFCNFPTESSNFGLDDIYEAIDRYIDSGIAFNHFLIGGGTDASPTSWEKVAGIASYIRTLGCSKPIYYMDVPPADIERLADLKSSGVTEVGFNIEVFDRRLARDLMPTKGRIPLELYFSALEYAVGLWGSSGAVRSALVVGLEPIESTLRGVEQLARRGVSPILSAFRPTLYSRMEDAVSPRNALLEEAYRRAAEICARYGVELGPSCRLCRNNVLAE